MGNPFEELWDLAHMDTLSDFSPTAGMALTVDIYTRTLTPEQRPDFARAFKMGFNDVVASVELISQKFPTFQEKLEDETSSPAAVGEIMSSAFMREIFASPQVRRAKSPSSRQQPVANRQPPQPVAPVVVKNSKVASAAIYGGLYAACSRVFGDSSPRVFANAINERLTGTVTYDSVKAAYNSVDTPTSSSRDWGISFFKYRPEARKGFEIFEVSKGDFNLRTRQTEWVEVDVTKFKAYRPLPLPSTAIAPAVPNIWFDTKGDWDFSIPQKQLSTFAGSISWESFVGPLILALFFKIVASSLESNFDRKALADAKSKAGTLGLIVLLYFTFDAASQVQTTIVPLVSLLWGLFVNFGAGVGVDLVGELMVNYQRSRIINVKFVDDTSTPKFVQFDVTKIWNKKAGKLAVMINNKIDEGKIYANSGDCDVEYWAIQLMDDWSTSFPEGTKVADLGKKVSVRLVCGDDNELVRLKQNRTNDRGRSPVRRRTTQQQQNDANLKKTKAQIRSIDAEIVRKDKLADQQLKDLEDKQAIQRQLAEIDANRANWVAEQDAARKNLQTNQRSLIARQQEKDREAKAAQELRNLKARGQVLLKQLEAIDRRLGPADAWGGPGGPDRRAANPYDEVVKQESEEEPEQEDDPFGGRSPPGEEDESSEEEEDESSGEYQEYPSSAHYALAATGGNVQKAAAKLAKELLLL
jgi:hypothetical protein